MESGIIDLRDKQTEQLIINISAKVADAVEEMEKAKKIITNSEDVLIKAQLELEQLFLMLGPENLKK